MKIFLRVCALPAVLIVQIIISVMVIITHVFKFVRHGGEFIIYEERNQAKTILDIYEKIAEQKTDKAENEKLIKKLNQLKGIVVAKEHLKKY